MTIEKFANLAEDELASGYTSGGSSISVTSAALFPAAGVFRVAIGNTNKTIYRVDSVSGTTFTGGAEEFDGNANSGDSVTLVGSKGAMERLIQAPDSEEIQTYSGALGVTRHGPIWKLLPVVAADFSWTNQGTATVTDGSGVSYLTAPTVSTNVRLRRKAQPSTPYTITILILPDQTTNNNSEMGLMLRESGTDKMVACCIRDNANMSVQRWSNVTTIGTTVFNKTVTGIGQRSYLWLRMRHDGTNIISSYSYDGINFVQIDTHAKTGSFTTDSDQVGYFVGNRSSGATQAMSVLSWRESS